MDGNEDVQLPQGRAAPTKIWPYPPNFFFQIIQLSTHYYSTTYNQSTLFARYSLFAVLQKEFVVVVVKFW